MNGTYRVVDFIVDFLVHHEVRHVFGVDGANIEDLYDAINDSGTAVRGVVAKHEFSAATMADGYHRSSQRIAAVATTSGAGAMNLVPGLAELRASYVPALVLIGQPPAALDGQGSFQETSGRAATIDAVRLFSELGVFCARVDDPAAITELLPRALAAATDAAAPGPAVLLLPKDVQQATLSRTDLSAPAVSATYEKPASSAELARAAELLRSAAERDGVVIVAGEGVARADARDGLARLADVLGAPVAVAPDARDVFDETGPLGLGVVGPLGRPEVRERVERASAVVLAGTRLPQMAGGGLRDHLKSVPAIVLDGREPFLHESGELLRLTGPLHAELAALIAMLEAAAAEAPALSSADTGTLGTEPTALDALLESPGVPPTGIGTGRAPEPSAAGATDPLTMQDVSLTVASVLPEGATVVSDAGNTGTSVLNTIATPAGGRYILALGMGGMGHSFGAGIGAAFATGRRSYVLAGDGAFLMHGMEVHTAVEHDLPVTFVIYNNNAHGACYVRELLFYSGEYTYNAFRPARIAEGVAAMFPGLDAVSASDTQELRAALLRARDTGSPSLICVDVPLSEIPQYQPFQDRIRARAKELNANEIANEDDNKNVNEGVAS
ncbi:thiamine pyrophosphate-binding protein [Streptomyces sp. NPDC021622]|uniref:thiamine pyrophosphate-binding protein n=1 Tax=Streptomyces sp. NPDC021622 TaxID=3155013 RepID=UPI0034118E2F